MTLIDSLRTWLRSYPPLSKGRMNVDCLPEEARAYSVDSVPGREVVKRYMDGSAMKEFNFVLASREFWGEEIAQNKDNLAFYEAFSSWASGQNRRPKNLPLLEEGREARSVEVTSSGYPFQVSHDGKARYQIQLKLLYFEKGRRL